MSARSGQPRQAPAVSFILLAYNQEKYIREALEGALSQDYHKLEIVVSDDRSSDRTFDIIRDIASHYSGPHRLVINQTQQNRGIVPHLYEAVGLCTGELIVGSAGDDISYPQRVSTLAERWRTGKADALFSRFDVIDEKGELIEAGPRLLPSDYDPGAYFPKRPIQQIRGVTSAYSRAVFEAVREPDVRLMAEDYFFALMLGFRSRDIEFVDEVLVRYRQHSESQGNVVGASLSLHAFETAVQKSSLMAATILRYFERVVVTGDGVDPGWGTRAEVDLARLRADIAFYEFRARWLTTSFRERLSAALAIRSSAHLVWILPRLFGLQFLHRLKRVRSALRSRAAR